MLQLPKYFKVTAHTDYVGPGSTFVAIQGKKQDGMAYIGQAIAQGATQIVIQKNREIPIDIPPHITILEVENPRQALADLSAAALEFPAKKLHIIGITGTKGKTSTTFILEHILKNYGYKTALLSTVHNKIDNQIFKTNLTTNQPDYLHHFFALCVEQNVQYVCMEVSAQALSTQRTNGILFDAVIFTNFQQEHGEFYNTMEDYFADKCKIFTQLKKDAPAFINADDPSGKTLLQEHPTFTPFGSQKAYPFHFEQRNNPHHLSCTISTKQDTQQFECPTLIGAFNCYNLLGAIAVAEYLGVPLKNTAQIIKHFAGIPGRLDLNYLKNGARCFIDYAHNPSSFHAVLSTLRPMTDHLIVLFGAGGERDAEKRPVMGTIASSLADVVILTSDNPRSEPPNDIIEQIYAGIPKTNKSTVIMQVNREKAIQIACKLSQKNSIIALLGKGPDEYQIIGDIKIKFSEKEIIQNNI